jgi:F-type H+-transporting ATPase subunit gamma
MANTQSLKRRIKSAGNIKQITKAMEMVSASKMRRAQSQAIASRPYSRKLESTLNSIAALTAGSYTHPLLSEPETGEDIVLLISTDKSLAGSLNTNLFRGAQEYIEDTFDQKPKLLIVGQKARQFAYSYDYSLYAEFSQLPDPISYADSLPVSNLVLDGFIQARFKSVHIIYMDFVSTLVQKVRPFRLLPLSTEWSSIIDEPAQAVDAVTPEKSSYVFEPSAEAILNWLLPYYVELSIYQLLLEAKASEHSARMVSMKNASENASDIISELTLAFNKARQASITAELLDNTTASLIVK